MAEITLYSALWFCVAAMGAAVVFLCLDHWRTTRVLEVALPEPEVRAEPGPPPVAPPSRSAEVLRRVLERTRSSGAIPVPAPPPADPGETLMAGGRFEEAVAHYSARANSDGASPDDFRALGKALANLGRMDEAVASWERMHARFPGLKRGG